jgi:hypothetical protein
VISASDIAAGNLTYVPGVHDTNPDSLDFKVADANAHITSTNTATLGIDITPETGPAALNSHVTVTEDKVYTFLLVDFGYSDTADTTLDPIKSVTVTSLPTTGTLYLDGHAVTVSQAISAADISAGKLTFTPNVDVTTTGTFAFKVTDTFGNITSSNAATMTINVTPDDQPVAVDSHVTITEDHSYTFQLTDFGYSDNDATPDPIKSVTVTSLPTTGTLYLDGHAVTANQVISAADIGAGKLIFTPGVDVTATGTFAFKVTDTIGTTTSPNTATMTINITPDDQPLALDSKITITEDHSYAFQLTDFGYSDNDPTPDPIKSVTVASLPTTGVLYLDGHAVTVNEVISAADIGAGKLTFTPNADVTATGSFTFQVTDTFGNTTSSNAATMTINVTPDDQPLAIDSHVTINEDHSYTFQLTDFGYSDNDPKPDPIKSITVASLPTTGTLYLDGHAVAANQVISAADISAGKLTFMPGVDVTASGTFGFQVADTFGNTTSSNTATMTIDVTPDNDRPLALDSRIIIDQNENYTFHLTDFGYSDHDSSPDPIKSIIVTSLPVTGWLLLSGQLVTAGQEVSATDISNGDLSFIPYNDVTTAGSFTFQTVDTFGDTASLVAATMKIDFTTMVVAGASIPGYTVNAVPFGGDVPQSDIQYQWFIDGQAINGATGPSYTVQPSDDGHLLTVSATLLDRPISVTSGPILVLPESTEWRGNDGDWSHHGSWHSDQTPGPFDNALIADTHPSIYTVTIDTAAFALSVTVDSPEAMVVDGPGGDLNIAGGMGGLSVNQGSFVLSGGTLDARSIYIGTDGTFVSQGNHSLGETIWNGGHFEVATNGSNATTQINGALLGDGTFQIDAGATLQFNTSATLSGPIVNYGNVEIHSGVLEIAQGAAVTGTGNFIIDDAQVLAFDGAASSNVTFAGLSGRLILNDPTHFTGTISGLNGDDAIDLANIDPTANPHASVGYSGGISTLTVTDSLGHNDILKLTGDYSASTWNFASDGHGGTVVVDPPPATNGATTVANVPSNDSFAFNFSAPQPHHVDPQELFNHSDPAGSQAFFDALKAIYETQGTGPVETWPTVAGEHTDQHKIWTMADFLVHGHG